MIPVAILLCCLAILLAGLCVGIIPALISSQSYLPQQSNMAYLRSAVLLEGISLGLLDAFGTAATSDMWASIAAIVGIERDIGGLGGIFISTLMKVYGFKSAYDTVAYIGFIPALVVLVEYVYLYVSHEGLVNDELMGAVNMGRRWSVSSENTVVDRQRSRSATLESLFSPRRGGARSRTASRIRTGSILGSRLAEAEESRQRNESISGGHVTSFTQVDDQLRSEEIGIIMQGIELFQQENNVVEDVETANDIQQFVHDTLQTIPEDEEMNERSRVISIESVRSQQTVNGRGVRSATLAYANPYIAEFVRDQPEGVDIGIKLTPLNVNILNSFNMFCLNGLSCSVGFWLMDYATKRGLTEWWPAMKFISFQSIGGIIGSLAYIPLHDRFSATSLLVGHVVVIVIATITLQIEFMPYVFISVTAFLMGSAAGNFFTLVLNLSNDFGFTK
jgi:hypothetical protein